MGSTEKAATLPFSCAKTRTQRPADQADADRHLQPQPLCQLVPVNPVLPPITNHTEPPVSETRKQTKTARLGIVGARLQPSARARVDLQAKAERWPKT